MHCAVEVCAGPVGVPGRHDSLPFEAAVVDFVFRVAGGGSRWPESEVRGNLTLLLRVIDEIIWCAQEWESQMLVMKDVFGGERLSVGFAHRP